MQGVADLASQHLVTSADTQKCFSILHRGPDRAALSSPQIAKEYFLLKVLPSADEEQVKLRKVRIIPDPDAGYAAGDTARLQALLHAQNIPSVPIQVQHLRIEVAYLKLHTVFLPCDST